MWPPLAARSICSSWLWKVRDIVHAAQHALIRGAPMNRECITPLEDRRLIDRLYVEELRVSAEPLTARDQRLHRAVNVSDTLYERRIGDDWVAFYRIVNQGGVPVVGEVRVYPSEPHGSRPPGMWSGEVRGSKASVPLGGITGRLLRRVRIDYQALATLVRDYRAAPAESLFAWAIERRGFQAERRLRRRPGAGRPRPRPEILAQAAVAYEQALLRGRPPLQMIARLLSVKASTARGVIARARKGGFLVPAKVMKRGVLLGRATKRAKAVLSRRRRRR